MGGAKLVLQAGVAPSKVTIFDQELRGQITIVVTVVDDEGQRGGGRRRGGLFAVSFSAHRRSQSSSALAQ